MTEAGDLRHIISIRTPPEGGAGALNLPTEQWAELCRCRAAVRPIRGRELWAAEQAQSLIDHRIILRWRPGISVGMRVLLDGRSFAIRYAIDVEERHHWLQLMCEEVQA